ncbi:EAL domain-containing protein [Herbaspirillum sp. RTI4]|uniref:EAL domain-containing protein n=1 Tax=Herbaspirillum sp. RTI4 TaxID=3048640 RepID=UPI002AB517C3|nr:EAL domain-containing protein [Herbaspirillum sp. RTI4]MDY7577673.1 EAL domain-containing protein [Herbaspirillum sp. RTI4]MEA9982161.1 EAL domain-containing protein [Herbaspirillum sp. RTI4]
MDKKRVILFAIVITLLCAPLPLAATFYLSWIRTLDGEQAELQELGHQVLQRTRQSFAVASGTLRAFDEWQGDPCSPDHITQMRVATVNTHSIVEIGYFENGLLVCTSWGMNDRIIGQSKPDFTTSDGMQVSLNITPMIKGSLPMMIMHYKSYNALINPQFFTDIIASPAIRLALATEQGQILGTMNQPDLKLLQDLIRAPNEKNSTALSMDESRLIALSHEDKLIALVTEPRAHVMEKLRRQQIYLLPVGVLLSLLIVGLAYQMVRRRLSPLGELKVAVARKEFIVHYQPLIDLRTGVCIGGEALVRWRRRDGSMVRPDLFIPLAEESGLILPITDQIVAAVVADLRELFIADKSVHIAINMSPQDIKTGRVLQVIENALRNTGIDRRQIWLEATERGFLEVSAASVTLQRAREAGHLVAIDDFGTGYSSLSYLSNLPLDALKIDKSFVDTIGTDSANSTVIPHIIEIAQSLKLSIVAEGVETQSQADYLLARNVDYGQGWLFAKAMPAADFIAFCQKNRAKSEKKDA